MIKRFFAAIIVVLAAAESAVHEGVQHGMPEDVAHMVPPAASAQQRATNPDPSQGPHTAGSLSESVPQPKLEGSSGTCMNGDLQVGATDAAAQGPSCTDQHSTHRQELTKQEELQQHQHAPRAPNHQPHVERPKRHPTIIPSPDEFERGQPDDGASIVAANKEAKKPEKAIDGDDDSYLKNSCSAQKWIIIELSQLGRIDELEIVNKEMYSSRLKDFTVRFHSHYGSEEVCALNSIRALGVSAAQELEDALAWHLHPDQLPSMGGMDASKELFESLPLPEATHSHVNKSPQQQQQHHQGSAAQHSQAQPHTATSHNHAHAPPPQQQGSAAHAGREGGGVGGMDGTAGAATGGSVGAGAAQGFSEGVQHGGGDGQHSKMDSVANGGAAADGEGHRKAGGQDGKEVGWGAGEGTVCTQGAHQDRLGTASCAGISAISSCGETSTGGGNSGGVNSDGNAVVGEAEEQAQGTSGQQQSTEQQAHDSAGGEGGGGEQPEEQGGSGEGRLERHQAQGQTKEDVQSSARNEGCGSVREGVKGDASESWKTQQSANREGVSRDGVPCLWGEGSNIEASVGHLSCQQQQQQQQQEQDAGASLGGGGAGGSTSVPSRSGNPPAVASESAEGMGGGAGCLAHVCTSPGSHSHPSGAQEQGSEGAAPDARSGDPHARREGGGVPAATVDTPGALCPCSESHGSPGKGECLGQHLQGACSQGDGSAPVQQQQQQQVHTDGRGAASAAGGMGAGPHSAEGDRSASVTVGGAAAAADAGSEQGQAHSVQAGAQTQQQEASGEGVQAGGSVEPGPPPGLDRDLNNESGPLGHASLPLDHPTAAADALQQPHTEQGGANSTASEQQAALDALHADHVEGAAAAGSSSMGAEGTANPPMGLQQHGVQPSSSSGSGSVGGGEDAQGQVPHSGAPSMASMHMPPQPGMAPGGVPGGVGPGGAPPDSPLAHIDHFLLAMEGGPTTRHRHASNLFDLFKQEFVLLRVNQTRIWKYINSLVDVLNKNAAEADEEVQRLERIIAEMRLEVGQVPAQVYLVRPTCALQIQDG
ncbi:hypothetical protein DUNSADRAFT_597 [Dunaliella salina]|uniref:Uncharacterized protein n=1 Tax=Dunaliella salina TaxID=3046 RepID=A0ABQ7GY48_DUNSA|nr:hypothetical protein DUNSADRAFT_597 [Dunaliella salina]|eukprot:KAF5839526.1 hypothetical protein DUNSADRAFT_597 [Dunaliella salina]